MVALDGTTYPFGFINATGEGWRINILPRVSGGGYDSPVLEAKGDAVWEQVYIPVTKFLRFWERVRWYETDW